MTNNPAGYFFPIVRKLGTLQRDFFQAERKKNLLPSDKPSCRPENEKNGKNDKSSKEKMILIESSKNSLMLLAYKTLLTQQSPC